MYIVRHHHNIQPSWNYHFVIQEKQMINGNQIKSIYAKGQLTLIDSLLPYSNPNNFHCCSGC